MPMKKNVNLTPFKTSLLQLFGVFVLPTKAFQNHGTALIYKLRILDNTTPSWCTAAVNKIEVLQSSAG